MGMRKFNVAHFKSYVEKHWFKILILGGIFVLLVKPDSNDTSNFLNSDLGNMTKNATEQNRWFQDISLDSQSSNSMLLNENTSVHKLDSKTVVFKSIGDSVKVSVDGEVSNQDNVIVLNAIQSSVNSREKLERNKKLIMAECIRREPSLSTWSHFDPKRNQDIPSFDYVLEILENRIGVEYLYSDVEKGVTTIMSFLREVSY